MRVTSHCVNHPSKEASQRCRSCRKWLCDNCFRRYGGRVYCGRSCQVRGIVGGVVESATDIARRPVHGAWAIAVSAAASALLLTAVGLEIGELVEVNRRPDVAPQAANRPPAVAARLVDGADPRRLVVEGVPGSRVLVIDGDRPLNIVTIGESGTVETALTDAPTTATTIRVVLLTDNEIGLNLPAVEPDVKVAAAATPSSQALPNRVDRRTSSMIGAQPTPAAAPPVLQLVVDAEPFIALTFDGNASANRTAELLDVLHELDLEVTLFVTGRFIERYPGIIRRAVLSGHEFGNHTYSHPHLTTYEANRQHHLLPGVTRERFQTELRRAEQAFTAATGRRMQPLWRAPFGEENRTLRGWALEMGYLHVRWSSLEGRSLDSRDWVADEHSNLYQSSSLMMERLLRFPELRGGIVLMHMSTDRPEPPWTELPDFVAEIRRRELEPTTVTALLESSATWRPWLRRARERHDREFERLNVAR